MPQITLSDNLKNGSSKNMAVNGSTTPVVFSYSPGGENVVAISKLVCLLDDPGAAAFNKFGSLTALTNGLLVSVTIGGVTTELSVIKDNADLATRFHNSHFGNSASDTLGGAVGFGDTYDAFCGHLEFFTPLVLSGSDSIQVTVRDNLSTVSTLQMAVVALKDV